MATTVKRVRKNPRKVDPLTAFSKKNYADRVLDLFNMAKGTIEPGEFDMFLQAHVQQYIEDNNLVYADPFADDHCYGCDCEGGV